MNIQELDSEINALQENIASMVDTIQTLRKREMQLLKEIEQLNEESKNQQQQIEFLKEKSKVAGLASSIDPEEKSEMKARINSLVREIDGCIAMIKS